MKYPATIVPVKAEEICRGPYQDTPPKKGCGCLAYHADRLFRGGSIAGSGDAPDARGNLPIEKAIAELVGEDGWWYASGYNGRAEAANQAEVFNRALLRIGYVRKGRLLVWAGSRKAKAKGKGRGK